MGDTATATLVSVARHVRMPNPAPWTAMAMVNAPTVSASAHPVTSASTAVIRRTAWVVLTAVVMASALMVSATASQDTTVKDVSPNRRAHWVAQITASASVTQASRVKIAALVFLARSISALNVLAVVSACMTNVSAMLALVALTAAWLPIL